MHRTNLRKKLQQDRASSPFLQQFAGGIVAFDKPVFDADTLTLMDFKVDQHPGSVHFAYVLPHDANKALIEITAFTPELYSEAHFHKAFIRYVERIASTKNCGYRLLEPEQGVIPMHIGHHARKLNPHTFTLGTQSGMVKPSTGYAFFCDASAGPVLHQRTDGGVGAHYEPTPPFTAGSGSMMPCCWIYFALTPTKPYPYFRPCSET